MGQMWRTWWATLARTYRSNPGVAVDPHRDPATTRPGSPWMWVFSAFVNGALIGFALMIGMARTNSAIDRYSYGYSGGVPGSAYAAAFLIPFVLSFGYLSTRAVSVLLIFRLRKRQIGFIDSANIVSVSWTTFTPLCLLAVIFALMPGAVSTFLLTMGWVFVAILAEVSLYVAIARTGRFEQSATVHYAWLTLAWLVLTTFVAILLLQDIVGAIALDWFSSTFGYSSWGNWGNW